MQVAAASARPQLHREDSPAHVPQSTAALPEALQPESGAYGAYPDVSYVERNLELLLVCQLQ